MVATFAALRTQVGIAKEAAKGTAVPPTAFIPVKKIDVAPKQIKLLDEGWRGSMGTNYGMQNGPRSVEVSMNGDVFSDTIGWLLAGVLGDVVTTGAATPYVHKMALLNSGDGQPKSYSLTDTQGGLQPRAFPGAQFSEVGFKWDAAGLMSWDAKALAWVGSTAAAPTATYGTLTPVANWLGALTLAATPAPNLQSGELNIKRTSAEAVFALGAQDPYVIHVGGVEVDGKFTFVAVDESPFLAYLNNTGPGALSATFQQGVNSIVKFVCTNTQYDDAKVTRGKAYVEIEASFKAILNSTDVGASAGLSPIAVSITNSLPSATYV